VEHWVDDARAGSSNHSTPGSHVQAGRISGADEVDQMLDLGFVSRSPHRPGIARGSGRTCSSRRTMQTTSARSRRIAARSVERIGDARRQTAERSSKACCSRSGEERRHVSRTFDDAEITRVLLHPHKRTAPDRVTPHPRRGRHTTLQRAMAKQEPGARRERGLGRLLRGGETGCAFATDIAARRHRLDGVAMSSIIELPQVAEAYVHRIGRTERAGKGRTGDLAHATMEDAISCGRSSD